MITRETDDVRILNLLGGTPGKKYSPDDIYLITGMRHNTAVALIDDTIPRKYGIHIRREAVKTETGKKYNVYWIDDQGEKRIKEIMASTRNWSQSETPCPIDGSNYVEDGVCNLCLKAGRVQRKV